MVERQTTTDGRPLVLAIVGPTAVGKTDVAIGLASACGGEVVSLDSRQMYRYLDIGTAKPSAAERRQARHHLVDIVDPDTTLALADVQAMAYDAIGEIVARGRRPIVAGGTGQYVRAVLEGWCVPRVAPNPARRAELEALAAMNGVDGLHTMLAEVDPISADRIDPRNVRRVIRAIEVFEATGEPISTLQGRAEPPFRSLRVGLIRPRPQLYERIDRRIDRMLSDGLEAEVRSLVERGYSFDLPAMSGVGYGEWRGLFEGTCDSEEVVRLIRHNTRRLVRSQMTWFRLDDDGIRWFDLEIDTADTVLEALQTLL